MEKEILADFMKWATEHTERITGTHDGEARIRIAGDTYEKIAEDYIKAHG